MPYQSDFQKSVIRQREEKLLKLHELGVIQDCIRPNKRNKNWGSYPSAKSCPTPTSLPKKSAHHAGSISKGRVPTPPSKPKLEKRKSETSYMKTPLKLWRTKTKNQLRLINVKTKKSKCIFSNMNTANANLTITNTNLMNAGQASTVP